MIESNEKLSQTRQCQLLSLARSTFYYQPQSLDNEKLALLRKLDEQYLKTPQYGARSYATWFVRQGISIGRKRIAKHDEDSGDCQHSTQAQNQQS